MPSSLRQPPSASAPPLSKYMQITPPRRRCFPQSRLGAPQSFAQEDWPLCAIVSPQVSHNSADAQPRPSRSHRGSIISEPPVSIRQCGAPAEGAAPSRLASRSASEASRAHPAGGPRTAPSRPPLFTLFVRPLDSFDSLLKFCFRGADRARGAARPRLAQRLATGYGRLAD